MDKYTKKYIRLIKQVESDQELSDIIDKIYTDGFDDGEESTETSQDKPKTKQIPKSPLKQGRIHQAEEYLKELKDLMASRNQEMIHIASDFDLDSLSKAMGYIKAFIQKQQ